MSTFNFEPLNPPFPRWMGPFSPARGNHCGFRMRNGQLGVWVEDNTGQTFWTLLKSCQFVEFVQQHWGGGRILMLPNGFVVKPLQHDYDAGIRALIGRWQGDIVLKKPNGQLFDLANPDGIEPGHPWPGPKMIGLECVIRQNGSLYCNWYHPTEWGQDEESCDLRGPDSVLAAGFHAARLGNGVGRVRITSCGHVITNRQDRNGAWGAYYVGKIEPTSWKNWEQWIGEE